MGFPVVEAVLGSEALLYAAFLNIPVQIVMFTFGVQLIVKYGAKMCIRDSVYPEAEVIVMPLADGGEGTVETLACGMGGEMIYTEVTGPLGDKIQASYGITGNTAVMEMASSSGLPLVPIEKRNPFYTTSFGVGDMIKDAIERGCREFIIGIGGSATNDGGVGMLQSLGFGFTDKDGKEVEKGGKYLADIVDVDTSGALKELKECTCLLYTSNHFVVRSVYEMLTLPDIKAVSYTHLDVYKRQMPT